MPHKSGKKFLGWVWGIAFLLLLLGISLWLVPDPFLSLGNTDISDSSFHAPMKKEKWDMPDLNEKRNLDSAYQMLIRKNPWGEKKTDGQGLEANQWHLKGVVHILGKPFALIEMNNVLRRYTNGDILPKGGVLQSVHDDYIKVLVEDNIRIIKLYMEKDPKGFQNP